LSWPGLPARTFEPIGHFVSYGVPASLWAGFGEAGIKVARLESEKSNIWTLRGRKVTA